MTIVCFTSVKGAPGVTTTACLVGATWPVDRRVLVAECDPAGGDLAARFALSSACGWSTYGSAVRRSQATVPIAPHLQQLPGGLDVLVDTSGSHGGEADRLMSDIIAGVAPSDGPVDVLADLGRLPPGTFGAGGWPDRSDGVVVVLRSDRASVMRVAERAPEFMDRWGDRVGLVVIGGGQYGTSEVERFIGITVVAELPFDRGAASVAAGERTGGRRLVRSLLTPAASRLADRLARWPATESAGAPGSAEPVADIDRTSHRRLSQRLSSRRLRLSGLEVGDREHVGADPAGSPR